jgi:hypothetical protein
VSRNPPRIITIIFVDDGFIYTERGTKQKDHRNRRTKEEF